MKKKIIIVIIILVSILGILGLYQTFALGGTITTADNSYTVTATDGTTVTVPASSNKTVYYKLTNTNNGTVKYGIGYSGTNIKVYYYTDTTDPVTGTVDYGKSKFIKLYIENTGTTSSTATLSTILGYVNGGDLIVPSGVTLVTEEKPTLASYITNLYNNSTTTSVVNNNVTYQYDTTHSLMKDVGNNIRYYGASPNNYIYFNCSDYSNQSSSTCETWRIIGVFDGKVKLIRNEPIGIYSWDNKNSSTGAESAYGKNDWTNARLMKLLNSGYESETTGGSLYYNAGSGNCYSGQNNITTACDFTSTGIKNDTTRNLIAESNYSLLGWNSSSVYADQIYEYERSTGSVYTGRPTEWSGKIALAYPSDYGYAADLGKCTKQLGSYSDSTCTANNWMKSTMTFNYNWLLTPNSKAAMSAWFVIMEGDIIPSGTPQYPSMVFVPFGVTPVLFLNSEIITKAGTGTSSNPYQILVD